MQSSDVVETYVNAIAPPVSRSTMSTPGDVMGFAHDAEGSNGGICIALLEALSDQMAAEGITGDPVELRRRSRQVFAGQRACPLLNTCKHAPKEGQKLIWQMPTQLKMVSVPRSPKAAVPTPPQKKKLSRRLEWCERRTAAQQPHPVQLTLFTQD